MCVSIISEGGLEHNEYFLGCDRGNHNTLYRQCVDRRVDFVWGGTVGMVSTQDTKNTSWECKYQKCVGHTTGTCYLTMFSANRGERTRATCETLKTNVFWGEIWIGKWNEQIQWSYGFPGRNISGVSRGDAFWLDGSSDGKVGRTSIWFTFVATKKGLDGYFAPTGVNLIGARRIRWVRLQAMSFSVRSTFSQRLRCGKFEPRERSDLLLLECNTLLD